MTNKKATTLNNRHNHKKFSILEQLYSQNKIDIKFEETLRMLSLEEIIQCKLELSAKFIEDNRFYGFKIYDKLYDIINEACVKFAISKSSSKTQAAHILGINRSLFSKLCKKLDISIPKSP